MGARSSNRERRDEPSPLAAHSLAHLAEIWPRKGSGFPEKQQEILLLEGARGTHKIRSLLCERILPLAFNIIRSV